MATTQPVPFPADLAANLAGIALQGRDLNWASSTIRNKINQLLAAAAAEMNASPETIKHSELCRKLNLSHWACDGTCVTEGVPYCEWHGMPKATCSYCTTGAVSR